MTRKVLSPVVALLVACALLLAITSAANAATFARSLHATIAADISAAFGPSGLSATPSLDNLLLTPDTAGVAPASQGNLTIWPNVQPGVSYAARYVDEKSAQQFVHINTPNAPTNYSFYLKPGMSARPGPNGSALLYDAVGQFVAGIPAPLAKDASGKSIPAHYTIAPGGTALVKNVEHNIPGVVYPVVADPITIMLAIGGAWFLTRCLVNGSKEARALKGQKFHVVLWGVSWVCVSVF